MRKNKEQQSVEVEWIDDILVPVQSVRKNKKRHLTGKRKMIKFLSVSGQ